MYIISTMNSSKPTEPKHSWLRMDFLRGGGKRERIGGHGSPHR